MSTWNACAQRHEGDGSDGILESDRASKGGGYVAYDGRQNSDPYDRYHEAKPTSQPIYKC